MITNVLPPFYGSQCTSKMLKTAKLHSLVCYIADVVIQIQFT